MKVKLPKMKKDEIENLIKDQMLCRIAFHGDEYPYIVPFQYIFMDGSLYFHFTNYGKKIKLLNRDQRSCVEIEKYVPDLSEYSFVVLRGTLKVVTDFEERAKVIKKIFIDNGFKILYDKDLDIPIADGFYFTVSYPGFTGNELVEKLFYYGISTVSLDNTGSEYKEGIRVCVSMIKPDQFPVLEQRLKAFKNNST